MTTITALLTCHNRKRHTLDCIDALVYQSLPRGTTLHLILVDDGSTDGTASAVQEAYPNVQVLHGDGSLFWAGGMRRAFAEALRQGADFYLWINDDTHLGPSALSHLLEVARTMRRKDELPIVVGTAVDPDSGRPTYGGWVQSRWWHPLTYELVIPDDEPVPCDVMNGNCVLIPDAVARSVGNIDAAFTHAIGDFDYAMRARRHGVDLYVAPEPVGTCSRNDTDGGWDDPTLSFRERLNKMREPKGLPLREWGEYARRYAGPLWPVYAIMPLARLVLSSLLRR